MSLYAIGDLHLSETSNKPMDIFGSVWENHTEKLKLAFSKLSPEDVTVICGDSSWGMDLNGALEDFLLIDSFPGRKIILKGNHDYWWTTATKMKNFFNEHGISSIDILNNNCFFYDEETAVCGTRGWFFEEETGSAHDRKILNRELLRLETSLKAAGDCDKYVFLHYPPKYGEYSCPEILDMLEEYKALCCCAGHIHGKGLKAVFEGSLKGTVHKMVSADYLDFSPLLLKAS